MAHITYKIAASESEMEGHFSVRHAVFVTELKMFEDTDRDKHDLDSILMVAVNDDTGNVIGAVRIYPIDNETWIGGRLAVLPEYRGEEYTIGQDLVAFGEGIARENGAKHLIANILCENVEFFKRLGWSTVSFPKPLYGRLHQEIESSFSAATMSQETHQQE